MAGLTSQRDLDEARRQLADHARRGALVVFVGAGVSATADPPKPRWSELVAPLREALDLPEGTAVDPLDLPQWFAEARSRAALHDHVRRQIAGGRPGKLHEALARLPVPVFVTTNYDDLLERAITASQGVPPDLIVEDAHVALIDERQRTTLLKMHGCLSVPGTIVLARSDYEEYAERHRAIVAYLQSLLATRAFLFVGFGLTDPNFRAIHHTIHRAVGAYQRPAYVLDVGERPDALVKYWHGKGLRILLFPETEGTPEEVSWVEGLAERSLGWRSGIGAARSLREEPPSPPLAVEELIERADGVRQALHDLVEQARRAEWLPRTGVETSGVEAGESGRWIHERARALLDLTLAVDGLSPLDDPGLWIALGDVLYEQDDNASAIRAYTAVLRPRREMRDPPPAIDDATLRRVRGNLGRAYARERHFARSEWLLRRCVFKPGQEDAALWFERRSVLDRLDLDHLERRPTDAYELVYAITRRAERLRAAGHFVEAFEAVREGRYLLEPVLGIGTHGLPAPRGDLFAGYRLGGESPLGQARRNELRGWALNFLGKAYRQSCELALDLRHGDALAAVPEDRRSRFQDAAYYLREAEKHLRDASAFHPWLPFPYGHRLHLQADTRLTSAERHRLLEAVRADLARLPAGAEPRAQLEKDFPALVSVGPAPR